MNKTERQNTLIAVIKNNGFNITNEAKYSAECRHPDMLTDVYLLWSKENLRETRIIIHPDIHIGKLTAIPGVRLKSPKINRGFLQQSTTRSFPLARDLGIEGAKDMRAGWNLVITEETKSEELPNFNIFLKKLLQVCSVDLMSPVPSEKITHVDLLINKIEEAKKSGNSVTGTDHEEAALAGQVDIKLSLESVSAQIEDIYGGKPGEDVEAIVKRRLGQGPFRSLLRFHFGDSCCISNINKINFLVASHIVRWSEAGPLEKTDPENGLLLSVNWDAAFDKGFVTFDDEGKALFSDQLDDALRQALGLDKSARLPSRLLTPRRMAYLTRHREGRFEHWKRRPTV